MPFVYSNLPEGSLAVRVGSSKHGSDGTLLKLKKYITHPKYVAAKFDFDFSLMELEKSLQFSDKIQAIDLPEDDLKIADESLCEISGWGNTKNSAESREFLRAAMVPVANQEYCNQRYNGMITPRMICAGLKEGGKDSCQGDSGGPMTYKLNGSPQLVGVVSFGTGCAQATYPGVYGRVTSVRSWIKSETGI